MTSNPADKMPKFQDCCQIENSMDLITRSPGLHHILEKIFLTLDDIRSLLVCENVNLVWESVLNNSNVFWHKMPEYFDLVRRVKQEIFKGFEVKHFRLKKPEGCHHFGFSVILWPSRFKFTRNEMYIYSGTEPKLNQLQRGN